VSLPGVGSLLAVASVTYVRPKAQPGTTVLVALASTAGRCRG
jgi:hypothetical protein